MGDAWTCTRIRRARGADTRIPPVWIAVTWSATCEPDLELSAQDMRNVLRRSVAAAPVGLRNVLRRSVAAAPVGRRMMHAAETPLGKSSTVHLSLIHI